MKSVETRSLTAELRVAKAEDGSRTISGYIPYGSESVDLGGFTEVIAQGAFASALSADVDILALRDHDPKLLLGRTKSKTLALTDSVEGLRYTITLPNTTQANDLAESIDRGDLDSTSFGFQVIRDKWVAAASGDVVRTLLEVDLMEVSPCSFPAYPESNVNIRSCPAEIRSVLRQREEKVASEDTPHPDEEPCGCPLDENGECTCPDEDLSVTDSLRNYMHVQLTLRQRK